MNIRPVALLASFLLALPASAQHLVEERPAIPTGGFGVQREGADVVAVGPGYRVWFREQGFELTAALGRRAPRSKPVHFQLESIHVGAEPVWTSDEGMSAPTLDGSTVAYARGDSVTERYEVRSDGVEQSFLFTERPERPGEIVVRGRLATELEYAGALADGGFELLDPGHGGVRFGGVTGIDAEGRRAAGDVRIDGDLVELVLPDAFVRDASWPLVLDPLIGTFSFVASADDESDPDISQFDQLEDVWMIVWERHLSLTDIDILAQPLSADSTPFMGLLAIEASASILGTNPTTCISDDRSLSVQMAAIVWQESTSIFGPWSLRGRAWSFAVADTVLGTPLTPTQLVSPAGGSHLDPDLGGTVYGLGPESSGVLVWKSQGEGIRARGLWPEALGLNLVLLPVTTVSTDPLDSQPAIAQAGTGTNRFLATWTRPGFSERGDVWGAVLSGDTDPPGGSILLDGPVAIQSSDFSDEESSDVAGRDDEWLVVYEKEDGQGSGDNGIFARRVDFDGGSIVVDPLEIVVADTPGVDERDPAVAFASTKYLTAWSSGSGFEADVLLGAVALDGANVCEEGTLVNVGFTSLHGGVELGSKVQSLVGSPPVDEDEVALVWERAEVSPLFQGDVLFQRAESDLLAPLETDLGGGCGLGGTASLSGGGPLLGNPNFTVELAGADPLSPVSVLNLTASSGLLIPCGTCVFLDYLLVFTVPLIGGSTSLNLPLPCDPSLAGGTLRVQWSSFFSSVNPCPLAPLALSPSLSNIVEMKLGF